MDKLISIIALICFLSFPTKSRSANVHVCDFIEVHYVHEIDRNHACEAATRIRNVMINRFNLRVVRTIKIEMNNEVRFSIGGEDILVLGSYNRETHVAQVTSWESLSNENSERRMFGLTFNRELHISLIAHEIMHGVNKDNYTIAVPGFASDEYIAYAAQLAVIDSNTLIDILERHPEDGFASLDEITELGHLANPHRFGVRSFRHFWLGQNYHMLNEIYEGRFMTFIPPL